ncbi:uncharacterized protein BDV17DRAFT_294130 [Aspergillus undulatus]|uniref:uncharacterized protein n=1 Tax=Aspergillus undulatus TaxID=1810928 RepID=UPI003CCC9CA0
MPSDPDKKLAYVPRYSLPLLQTREARLTPLHAGALRRFLSSQGTQIIVRLSGVNATSYYLLTVLTSSVGLGEKLSRLLTACNSVHYISFSYLDMMLIDKWGRRGAMLIGSSENFVCYLLILLLIRFNQLAEIDQQS